MTLHEQFKKLKRAKALLEIIWVDQYNAQEDMTLVNKDLDDLTDQICALYPEVRARLGLGLHDQVILSHSNIAVKPTNKPIKLYQWNQL